MATSTLTINDYLQVIPNQTLPDRVVQRALGYYDVSTGVLAFSVTEQTRDLMEAMMWDAAKGYVSGGGISERIDNRSRSESSIQATDADKASWKANAARLRAKWGVVDFTETNNIYDATPYWG
jgi:hypothetical protein